MMMGLSIRGGGGDMMMIMVMTEMVDMLVINLVEHLPDELQIALLLSLVY